LKKPSLRELAAEIIRRASSPDGVKRYAVRVSDPPTSSERLQLIAARLEARPIVILPHKCATVDNWIEQYGSMNGG